MRSSKILPTVILLFLCYLPLTAGSLVYEIVSQEEYIYQSVLTEFYIVESWEDGVYVDSVLIRIDGDYLMFYGDLINGVPVFEPDPIIIEKVANITPGDTWTGILEDWPTYEMAVGEVEKTVPAGTFAAMEIDFWDDNDHNVYIGKKWLAEGVGLLGYEGEFMGITSYQLLTSYTYVGGSGYWPLAVGNELVFETGESMVTVEAPYVTIAVDGDASDWVTFEPAVEDPEGDDPSGYDGVDIKELYIAFDDVNLYMMFTFWDGGPTTEWGGSRTGAYQVYVMPDDDENEELGHISYYEPDLWLLSAINFSVDNTLVVCGDVMECSIPLDNLGNPLSLYRYSLSVGDMDEDYDKSNMVSVKLVPYVSGDANGDESVNVGDLVYLLNFVFHSLDCALSPPIGCPPEPYKSGDANCDGSVNVGDGVYISNYIYKSLLCATNPPIGCAPEYCPKR